MLDQKEQALVQAGMKKVCEEWTPTGLFVASGVGGEPNVNITCTLSFIGEAGERQRWQ